MQAGTALALTISATATGSATPPIAYNPDHFLSVISGSFTYTGWSSVGDGNDEDVDWTFDFKSDPNYAAFVNVHTLGSARLTMTLIPQNYLVSTDQVRIADFGYINTPVIQTLPVGVVSTINLELLKFYTANEILDVFQGNSGTLPMRYNDDAIITYAQLDLSTEPFVSPVPEPATLVPAWPRAS